MALNSSCVPRVHCHFERAQPQLWPGDRLHGHHAPQTSWCPADMCGLLAKVRFLRSPRPVSPVFPVLGSCRVCFLQCSLPVAAWFSLSRSLPGSHFSSVVSACNGSAFSSSGSPQGHCFLLHWAPTGKASSSSFPWCLEGRFSASPTYEALRNSPPPREPWFSPSQRRQHFSPGE